MANDVEVAVDAINVYGVQAQLRKAAEELMELSVECMHMADGNGSKPQNIAEEVADVQFMLLQLKIVMSQLNANFVALVDNAYQYKIDRTALFVNAEKQKKAGEQNAGNNPDPTN